MLYLRKDSKVKANNVAKEYNNCQVTYIIVVHLILPSISINYNIV